MTEPQEMPVEQEPVVLLETPQPETALDPRIRIRAALRCGGLGRLDCAEDAHSGRRLAVRWLPLAAGGQTAAHAMMALPAHPSLPTLLQTGRVGQSAFVAMDFPEGHVLSTWNGEPLEPIAVIRLGAQLSQALATLHAGGVLHGELSCDSVLLVEPDRAILWDMPLVLANRLTDRRGEDRQLAGLAKLAASMAPERARGEDASRAADVYALGSVLCFAAGAPKPQVRSTLALVHQLASLEWRPSVPAMLPDPVRGMLEQMLSQTPSQRPPAAAVARLLGELLDRGPSACASSDAEEIISAELATPEEITPWEESINAEPKTQRFTVPPEPGSRVVKGAKAFLLAAALLAAVAGLLGWGLPQPAAQPTARHLPTAQPKAPPVRTSAPAQVTDEAELDEVFPLMPIERGSATAPNRSDSVQP